LSGARWNQGPFDITILIFYRLLGDLIEWRAELEETSMGNGPRSASGHDVDSVDGF